VIRTAVGSQTRRNENALQKRDRDLMAEDDRIEEAVERMREHLS
jgi:hypothetical protein